MVAHDAWDPPNVAPSSGVETQVLDTALPSLGIQCSGAHLVEAAMPMVRGGRQGRGLCFSVPWVEYSVVCHVLRDKLALDVMRLSLSFRVL